MFRGTQLCNSLRWVDWHEAPTQVEICDDCGTPGCASGGYVHVSHLGEFIIWTPPQVSYEDDFARAQYALAWPLETLGALAFPVSSWIELAVNFGVPPLDQIPDANGHAVCDAWVRRPSRPVSPTDLTNTLRDKLVACETLETAAIDAVDHWLRHLSEQRWEREPRLIENSQLHGQIETLYFDGPGSEDWAALRGTGTTYFHTSVTTVLMSCFRRPAIYP